MGNRLYSKRMKKEWERSSSKPKAFKSEETAHTWAKENNIKDYTLRNLRKDGQKKKIKISRF